MKRKSDTNIAYLIFREDITSNLIRRQVLEIIIELKKLITYNDYYLIAFIPWHLFYRKNEKIKETIKECKMHDIKCQLHPIPLPFPFFNFKKGWHLIWSYNILSMIFSLFISLPVIIFYIFLRNIRIFHCRSYPISLAVTIIKMIYPKIKFIFDPRSDFPEERLLQENWHRDGINFKLWKSIEKQYLKNAEAVISIGDSFDRHVKDIYKNTNSTVIHNNVDTKKFHFDRLLRNKYRSEKGINDKIIFCYAGSLRKHSWNDPELYAKFIKKYSNSLSSKVRFLFLIPKDDSETLKTSLKKYNVDLNKCFIENPDFENFPSYLSIADIGMYFLSYSSPRVGTKFVEYCAGGLPTIANVNVAGATELIDKYDLGMSLNNKVLFDEDYTVTEREITSIEKIIKKRKEYSKRCRDFAVSNFDNLVIVSSYRNIYKSLGF